MASEEHNLSNFEEQVLENCQDFHVGLVVSEWNSDITQALAEGAKSIFEAAKISRITHRTVPGSFELPLASQLLFQSTLDLDGIVVIGNVIQGETKHFDFVCQGLTQGIMQVMLKFNKPVSFCVLTDLNKQQSLDRSGGKHGNKGVECAVALLKMIKLQQSV